MRQNIYVVAKRIGVPQFDMSEPEIELSMFINEYRHHSFVPIAIVDKGRKKQSDETIDASSSTENNSK